MESNASRSRLIAAALILGLATAGAAGTAGRSATAASGSVTNIVITDTRSPTFEGTSLLRDRHRDAR